MLETTSLKLIDEICKEKGIEEKKLSFGWIRELKKDDKVRHIVRNTFDLNPASSYDIVNDKYATYEVLKSNNVQVLEHTMIFNPISRRDFAKDLKTQAEETLKKYNGKVVVKANYSSEGKDVYIAESQKRIVEIVTALFESGSTSVSVCPYVEIESEYRVIYLDGNIEFVYRKEKPTVIGDGKRTILELANLVGVELENNLNYIPKEGEKVEIGWKHNLCNGAQAKINLENDECLKEVKEMALNAAKATNVKFASIDISKLEDGTIFVMEINGSVCMSKFIETITGGREIAKNIYSKAIDKMFA